MNKPEKKGKSNLVWGVMQRFGYNQACDDWEKFLPNVEEIEEIINAGDWMRVKDIAKTLSERIGGK